MPLHVHAPPDEIHRRIREAIEQAIPGARVEAAGSGGHYEIHVVAEAFEGRSTLARQRMVYAAIAPLMRGDEAPVHAVDRLETTVG